MVLAVIVACGCLALAARPGSAFAEDNRSAATVHFSGITSASPPVYGLTRSLVPGLRATYGLGLADETNLNAMFLRFDRALLEADPADRSSRDLWRHFLGVEFAPADGVALLGGIAKSGGSGGGNFSPTGYERLRLSTGARWRGTDWGLDGSFAFIPTGATRYPGDAGFLPGTGGSGSTWLLSFTVSRRF
ncbi:MAG: hypothetical protein ABR538_14925 [Candidatus Binatia bacterium]